MASSLLMQHQILSCDPWSAHRPASLQRRRLRAVEVKAEKSSSSSSRSGESLWRSELSSSSSLSEEWSPEEGEEQEVAAAERQVRRKVQDDEKGGVMEIVGSVVEKLLVADFFFILFILVWFLAGLAEKAAFDTSALIDAWLPLWSRLFQPALGFFMAGSLWTAVSKNWLKR